MCASNKKSDPCGAKYPWRGYEFLDQSVFKVPELIKESKFSIRLTVLFHPNTEGFSKEFIHESTGSSVAGKPLNLYMHGVAGGTLTPRWNIPNDTGGVNVTGFGVQVKQMCSKLF
jgi:hypothetical protein